MSGQGLQALTPSLFHHYQFLDKLYLDHNGLTKLPPEIGRLRHLTHLDVSGNMLTELPPEVGMLVNLITLLAFDNKLQTLPFELGSLFKLETLGIEGNKTMFTNLVDVIKQQGTKAIVHRLKESASRRRTLHLQLELF